MSANLEAILAKANKIKDNTEIVYEKGRLSVVSNVNCLKGQISGSIISIKDVSPVEHDIEVQVFMDTFIDDIKMKVLGTNLFNLKDREVINFGASSNTTQRKFSGGKGIILKYNRANYYLGSGVTDSYVATPNLISYTVPSSNGWYGIGFDIELKPNTKYKFSYGEKTGNIFLSEYDAEGNYLKNTSMNANAITTADTTAWGVISFTDGANITISVTNPQFEEGDVATDYEPYTEINYTVNADGSVSGIKSIYPSMTLMSDTDGVIITANYIKDINKTFDAIKTNVALSGGE